MPLKRKIYISVIIFLGLIISLTVFILYPLFLEIKEASYIFPAQKQALAALEEKVENLEKFKKILPEISPDLEKIDHFFIDPEVPVDFIRFLEELAKDSGLFYDISFDRAIKIEEDPWPSVPFRILLAGSFSDFSDFLEKLESSSYLIEIQNLNIARLTEAELRSSEFEQLSLGDLKANFLIKVYTK